MRKIIGLKHFLILSLILVMTMLTIFVLDGTLVANATSAQIERTVSYDEKIFDQNVLNEFDEYEVVTDEKDIQFTAKKNFDMSILEEIDLVGLNESEDTFTVRYEINYIDNDSAVLMTVTIEGEDDIPVVETIPGLTTINEAGEPDVMFVVEGEYIWLSDLNEFGAIDESGWFSKLVKAVTKAVTTVANAVAKVVVPIVAPAIRATVNVLVSLDLGDEAAYYGAKLLNMKADDNGIYHAHFDCWQSIFGYTDFYDTVFNAATSMKNGKFAFDVDGNGIDDYIIWLWKGDYLNLGAGAELGIYKRWEYSDEIWIVDKSEAMLMTLKLEHKGNPVFNWCPQEKQWWITGFNPAKEFLNVNANDLTATYTVTFNNYTMYNSFKKTWNQRDARWSYSSGYTATFKF